MHCVVVFVCHACRVEEHFRDKTHRTLTSELPLYKYALGACMGLEALHSIDLCHNDFKPQNVLVSCKDGVYTAKVRRHMACAAQHYTSMLCPAVMLMPWCARACVWCLQVTDFGSIQPNDSDKPRPAPAITIRFAAPEVLE